MGKVSVGTTTPAIGVAVRVGVAATVVGVLVGVFVGVDVATPAGVFVGVLVGVFVTAPSPHSPVWHSKAPMSQPEPCGREMPRWSVLGGGQPTAALIAGLPVPSAWVCVGPP